MVSWNWRLASACLGAFGLLGCSEIVARTQLMVVADTDIADLDTIRFEVSGDGQSQTAESRDLSAGPATLALIPKGSDLGPLTVTARGLRDGDTVVERSAEVSFVAHQTLVVQLHLLASCEGVVCGDTETCGEQGCQPRALSSDELSPWDGDAPRIATDDPDASLDAGTGNDADAAAADETGPGMDGSPDLGDAGNRPDTGAEAGQPSNCGGDATQVDLMSDVNNCGMCRNVCRATARNTVPVCNQGSCGTECRVYFGDCDGNASNGCEQSLFVSAHCGTCENACGMGEVCRFAACY